MTREEAKQNLVALGIEEPTEAQVTNYLNQFHGNKTAPVQNPVPANNPQNDPAPNQPQDDEEIRKLQEQIATLQKENIKKDIKAYAAEKGLTGEQAEKVLSAFQDNLEVAKGAIDSMSQIISDKETAAAQKKEQEIADGSLNPGGGSGKGGKDDEKPEDVKNAENIFFGNRQEKQDVRDYYVLK